MIILSSLNEIPQSMGVFPQQICSQCNSEADSAGGESELKVLLSYRNYKKADQGQTNTPHPCVQDTKGKGIQPGWIQNAELISQRMAQPDGVNG
jgi:hypothetical protein